MDTCPNGCDLTGPPIEHPDLYGGATHYSRMIGIDGGLLYDGVIAWHCPDCELTWPRPGFESLFSQVQW